MKILKIFITFVAIPLILVLSILEAGVRISGKWGNLPYKIEKGDFNFEWGWSMPSQYFAFDHTKPVFIECQEFRYDYKVNTLGVREREMDPHDTSEIRLFVYGDSFVEGNGAAYDSTWPRRIEELMMAEGKNARVSMTGVSSSDPFYAYVALRDRLLDYRPTHFIVSINDSDFDNYAIRGGFSRFRKDGSTHYRKPPPIYIFYRYSHLARMAAHEYLGYDHYLIKDPNSEANLKEAADSIGNAMFRIDSLCREKGIRFLAVIHPVPHTVCFESDNTRSDVLAFDTSQVRYPAVFMYKPLKGVLTFDNCYDYCWRIDSHFNGRGYRMFGELVYEAIREKYMDFWEAEVQ